VRYRTEWTVRMEHNQICGKTYLDNQHESPPVQAGAEKKSDGGDMNRNFIAGSLKQFRGKLKEQWSELTNDQLGVLPPGAARLPAGRRRSTEWLSKNRLISSRISGTAIATGVCRISKYCDGRIMLLRTFLECTRQQQSGHRPCLPSDMNVPRNKDK
jgi:hypothetical protein